MVNFTMLVRNRPVLTKQALDSLGAIEDVTVTIRNDRSNEETHGILAHWLWGSDPSADNNRWLFCVNPQTPVGTGQARNEVIAVSERKFGRGDFLYLSDNDVFFKPRWLRTLLWAYKIGWHEGVRVLGAYNHPYHKPTDTLILGTGICPVIHVVNALATQSMLMSWDVWDRFGPFCDTPVDRVCMSEDHEFSQRIRKAGYKVGVVDPPLIVSTGITNTFGEKVPGWELVKAQCPEGVICE
jgi:hypothetical protein